MKRARNKNLNLNFKKIPERFFPAAKKNWRRKEKERKKKFFFSMMPVSIDVL